MSPKYPLELPSNKYCAKCKTTDSPEYIPIEYPEDDGTTTLHHGCTWCIEEMCDFVEARIEGIKALKEAGYDPTKPAQW